MRIHSLILYVLLFIPLHAHAAVLNVAVASNFTHALRILVDDFQNKTGHEIRVISASTGKLYAQIKHGAPFDVFLAADEIRPDKLVKEGYAQQQGAHIYALGKIVMISNIKPQGSCQTVLSNKALRYLAIANPDISPYGLAAKQTLEYLNLWGKIKSKLVMGENVSQTLHFVATANADVGFIAAAILSQGQSVPYVCKWNIPEEMYAPIRQKMVLLKSSDAAQGFLEYMQTRAARKIIQAQGYGVI